MPYAAVAGERTERKKQDPSPTSCRDRSKPAVPPCLTLARPLSAYENMPTFVNGASAPACILAIRLSARPRKSIRSRPVYRVHSTRDSLEDELGIYLPFLIGLLDCSTPHFSCQGVFQKKFFRRNAARKKRGGRFRPPRFSGHSIGSDCFSTGLVCFFGSVTFRTPLSSFALMPSRSISETSKDRLYEPKERSQRI